MYPKNGTNVGLEEKKKHCGFDMKILVYTCSVGRGARVGLMVEIFLSHFVLYGGAGLAIMVNNKLIYNNESYIGLVS